MGTTIQIDLRMPDGPVFLGGEVVWVRDRREPGRSVGCGVRLTDRSIEYVKQIKRKE